MSDAKLSDALRSEIRTAEASRPIVVVLELERPDPRAGALAVGRVASRADAIALRKAAFREAASPVIDAVARAGGSVEDEVWLNATLRVSIAPDQVGRLAALASVKHLDLPHRIEPEASDFGHG